MHSKHVKKFKATATDYRLKLKKLDLVALQALPTLSAIIDDVLQRLTTSIRPRDMVRIILQAPGLDKPIALPFIKKDDLTMDRFMARVEHVLQSKKDVKLDSDMQINFVHMEMPDGGKWGRKVLKMWSEKKKDWNCIIPITNQSDNMCLARAIVTGRAKQEMKCTDYVWRRIKEGKTIQRDRAIELHVLAGVPTYAPCGLEQVEAFQKVVENYQLCVVSKEHLNKIIYQGPPKPKGIYLLYNDSHFDLITSMAAYLDRKHWCHDCKIGYDHKQKHRCRDTCRVCRSGNCLMSDRVDQWVRCSDCKRYFKSRECYENHKRQGSAIKKFGTVCKQYFKCEKCDRVVNKNMMRKGEKHDCTELWCRVCQSFFPAGHKCYIKPVPIPKHGDDAGRKKESFSYIFFDVESRQETGVHKPNLCVAQKSCETCAPHPWEEPCAQCGETKQMVFKGEDCMERFCLWLFKEERHRHAVCLAHNLKGYDGYFILQFLYDNGIKPNVIFNGARIMSVFVPEISITFKDSLNFFPMALSKLPKAFGIEELCKGHYPHLMNTKENEGYVGELPAVEFYDPNSMSESGKKQFLKWYDAEKKKGEVWDLQKELLKYCVNDVDILRRCCMQFRSMFMEVTKTDFEDPGVDPLEKPITIASACNLVLRRNFLEPESIAIIPPNGYGPGQNFSKDSIRWLNYESRRDGSNIVHAMNGGEVRLHGRVTADGICFETRKIYSYLGCLFHACRSCYDEDTINPLSQKPMAELYRLTIYRRNQIRTLYPDFELVEIWEHDWRRIWKDLPAETKTSIDVTARFEPLAPREALYGGRTEATKLYHKIDEDKGEVIRYLDFTR